MIIKKPYYFVFLYLAFVMLLVLLTGCGNGQGLEIVVSNTEDSGEGSLRWALEVAVAGDTIIFDPDVFSPFDPATINIQSRLPALDQGSVTIDASNAGVILNGAFAGENDVNGLEILSSNNTIRGLQIINFQNGAGIALSAEAKENLIGGDRATGAGPCGQGNQLSANETGISLAGSSVTGNIITGNLIGTNENGQRPYRNIGNNNGITISDGASANTIGEDNIIAFNETYGLHILGDASESNTITRNSIFSNGAMAIYLEGGNAGLEAPVITEFNINNGTVKGSACAGCTVEVFSSNGREGKFFEGDVQTDEDGRFSFSGIRAQAPRFTVTVTDAEGNTSEFSAPTEVREIVVGSTEDSGEGSLRQALQEAQSGDIITFNPEIFPPETPATIYLERELPVIRQGHLTLDASNAGVILDGTNADNQCFEINASYCTVMGLQIVNFKNGPGILLSGNAQYNVIGGDRNTGAGPLGQGNLLSGNDTGIVIFGTGATNNIITGNLIGTDISGKQPFVDGGNIDGVGIRDGATKNIIGPGNIIAFNQPIGILVNGSNTLGNSITRNNIHSNQQSILFQDGGNANLRAPIVIDFNLDEGKVEGIAEAGGIVEIYSDSDGEGLTYEGEAHSNQNGWFMFFKGSSIEGPRLIAINTDLRGNTGYFSDAVRGSGVGRVIQLGNDAPRIPIETYLSSELEDNRIGNMYFMDKDFWHSQQFVQNHAEMGIKWIRLGLDKFGLVGVDWSARQESTRLESRHIDTITDCTEAGMQVICGLIFWDIVADGKREFTPGYARFRDEGEVERYLEFVRDTVRKLRGKVAYYELLNEPNISFHHEGLYPTLRLNSLRAYYDLLNENDPGENIHLFRGSQHDVTLSDYVSLIEKVVPIIKEEDPEAKVAVGAVAEIWGRDTPGMWYLFGLMESSAMPLVDAVTFHPLYNVTPQNEEIQRYAAAVDYKPPKPEDIHAYYENYPAVLREMRETAKLSGFQGVFIADEITYWCTLRDYPLHFPAPPLVFPEIEAAKYYIRSIVLHLGMDMMALATAETIPSVVSAFSTVLAGHEAIDMQINIEINYTGPLAYCSFRFPNGDRMLAVWTDGVAVDEDPGVPATITFPGLTTDKVTGIDVLHGLEQDLVFTTDGDTTVVKDVLVKDYPVLIRLNNPTMSSGHEETVGDGFHRLER